jgi:hypothetical protein
MTPTLGRFARAEVAHLHRELGEALEQAGGSRPRQREPRIVLLWPHGECGSPAHAPSRESVL